MDDMTYIHIYGSAGDLARDRMKYPELPWQTFETQPCTSWNKIEYEGKIVLKFPPGTIRGEIGQKTKEFFMNQIRKEKLAQLCDIPLDISAEPV